MVTGNVVAHLKPQKNSSFRQICDVLYHHYSIITTGYLLST